MKRRIRHLWHITSWPERVVTILSPVMPILAAGAGDFRETGAWVIAGLWWAMYLTEKVDHHDLRVELAVRVLFHNLGRALLQQHDSAAHRKADHPAVRYPRRHR